MVRNETLKLVLRGDPLDEDHDSELYDLVRDPRETENLYRFEMVLAAEQNQATT